MIPWVREQIAEAWHSRKSSRTAERASSLALSNPSTHPTTDNTMFLAPSTSSETFTVNIISLEGDVLEVPSRPEFTVERIKTIATKHFYPNDSSKTSALRLIHPRNFRALTDGKQLSEEEVRASDELLMAKVRLPPGKDPPEESLKGPTLEAINKATAHLPAPAPPRPSPSTDCPADFQTEIRKILITLVQASARILSHSPEAPRLEEMLREKLEQRSQPPNDPKTVKYLVDIGFPEKMVIKALKLKKMNTSEALDWLIDHQDDEDNDEDDLLLPLVPESVQGEGSSDSVPPGTSSERKKSFKTNLTDLFKPQGKERKEVGLIQLVALLLQSFSQYKRLEFRPSSRIKESLVEMGFEEKNVVETLKITGNNQNNACEWLLGARRRSLQDLDEGLRDSGPIYNAIMNNPHIQLSLTNPKMLMAYLSILETPSSTSIWINDPEVSPVLSQIFKTYHSEKHAIHMNRYENS